MWAEVILPLPLNAAFTYEVPDEMRPHLRQGHRVIVQFGKKKHYTGIVASVTTVAPQGFEPKKIIALLDDSPVIKRPQLQLWEWVAEYYLCSVGEVMKAALPAGLKIESETFIEASPDWEEDPSMRLGEREIIVMQTLLHAGKRMSVGEIERATGLTNVNAVATRLLDKGAAVISERLVEKYAPRKVTYVRLTMKPSETDRMHEAFDAVKSARRQEQALLALIELSGAMQGRADEVTLESVKERAGVSTAIVQAMAQKGIVEIYRREINRFSYEGLTGAPLPVLSDVQKEALDRIHRLWLEKDVNLLRGVTSSGKTEIYIHLIDYVLKQKRQVLYLVPEIALTTQLTARLQRVFGSRVVIYHSKFTDNERVDIWKKMLSESEPVVVIGARSSVFLPFGQLGLVIVDEEHEQSYKQQDPAPRYNARDTAMVLARMHGAKTLLGSATPAIDTYYKAQTGRYGLVELTERYGNSVLPEIEIVDMVKARKKGQLSGPLAEQTRSMVSASLELGEQAIVFINRRGFAPVAECKMCGWTPKCEHCDVTLTYHKRIDRLVCHYCGSVYPMSAVCPACKEPAVDVFGYGTERVEDEVEAAFPGAKIQRMDLDSTRNKEGYEKIIRDFSERKSQILVGTQMVSKGLDFEGVSSVVVVNADMMVNIPDFRSAERAFNMLEQVAGRAGRRENGGRVAIQTRQPEHPLFSFVARHDYDGYYRNELAERKEFCYPPFTRLIYIYIKHRDPREADIIAAEYSRQLHNLLGNRVFGPEEPAVGRVQNLYIRKIMLKIEVEASMKKVRDLLRNLYEWMHSNGPSAMKGATVYYDVDPM